MRIAKIAGLAGIGIIGAVTVAAVAADALRAALEDHQWHVEETGVYNHPTRKLFMTDDDAMRALMQPRRDMPHNAISGS